MGSLCSLLVVVLVCIYGQFKYTVLLQKKDVDIISMVLEYHYDDLDSFGFEDGLNVAVAFTAFDNGKSWILDDSYGELVF